MQIEKDGARSVMAMEKADFDVVVVGGGPAGLSAALAAAKSGARVGLFERSKEIGYPIHTSGGSWIQDLQSLGIPDRFWAPVTRTHFYSATAHAQFDYHVPVACVVDVRGLYQYLGEQAARFGVTMHLQTPAEGALISESTIAGIRLKNNRCVSARVVIDASGMAAVIAREVGLVSPPRRYGLGVEWDLLAPEWPAGDVALILGTAVAPAGYAWIFAHDHDRVRVGVGIIRPISRAAPAQLLEKFFDNHRLPRGVLRRNAVIECHTGAIPSEPAPVKTHADGLLVVGDAGRQISILLGEGIRYAIAIGRMAGEVAATAALARRTSAKELAIFDKRWRRQFGRTFAIGAALNARLATYTDQQWDDKIRLLAELDAGLVPRLLRGDFSPTLLWQVARRHPQLIGRTLLRYARR